MPPQDQNIAPQPSSAPTHTPPAPQAPQPPLPQGSASTEHTNTLAIISLILAFFFPLIAVVLAIIALSQIKSKGEKGKKLAIAGIVLSIVFIILGVVVAIFVLRSAKTTITTTTSTTQSSSSSTQSSSSSEVSDEEAVKQQAEDFMQAMSSGSYQEAYDMLSSSAQTEAKSPEDLGKIVTDNKVVPTSWDIYEPVSVDNSEGVQEMTVSILAKYEGGTSGPAKINMVKNGSTWKIVSFDFRRLN